MIKKFLLILIIAAGLSGCGGGNSASDTPTGENPGVVSRVELMATSYVNQTNGYCYLKTKAIDGNGSPIANRQVVWTNLSTTGVLDRTTSMTNASGIATATLYSTTWGFATVQAEVNADNTGTQKIRDKKTVYFTPFDMSWPGTGGASNLASMALDVDSDNDGVYNETNDFILFEPAGKTDAIIRATVRDTNGNLLMNSAVTFGSDSPEVTFPSGSSTTAPVVHTNAQGQASVLARVSPAILRDYDTTVNITAKADNNAFNVVSLFLKPITINSVAVTADPSIIDSAGTSTITARVTTTAGQPAPQNTIVNFTTGSGAVVTPFAATDAKGIATATMKAPVVTTGTLNVGVTATSGGRSGTATVAVRSASSSTPVALNVIPASQTLPTPPGPLAVGNTARYTIIGGVAPYQAFSDKPMLAQVTVSGTAITAMVSGIPTATETVTISVYDAAGTTKSVALVLNVGTTTPPGTLPLTVIPSTQNIANPVVGSSATFNITGGTSPYFAFSSSSGIMSCNIAGGTLSTVIVAVPTVDTDVTCDIYDSLAAMKTITVHITVPASPPVGALNVVATTATTVVGVFNNAPSGLTESPADITSDNVSFSISGGLAPYSVSSNTPSVIASPNALAGATFTVDPQNVAAQSIVTLTVSDSAVPVNTKTVTVTVMPLVLSLDLNKIVVIGIANPDASSSDNVTATIVGGKGPYVVTSNNTALTPNGTWSYSSDATPAAPFIFTFDVNNVAVKTDVTLTVFDNAGATLSKTLSIFPQTTGLAISVNKPDVVVIPNLIGAVGPPITYVSDLNPVDDITFTVIGGVAPYAISVGSANVDFVPAGPWNISASGSTITIDPGNGGATGSYVLTVTDSVGAISTTTFVVHP